MLLKQTINIVKMLKFIESEREGRCVVLKNETRKNERGKMIVQMGGVMCDERVYFSFM